MSRQRAALDALEATLLRLPDLPGRLRTDLLGQVRAHAARILPPKPEPVIRPAAAPEPTRSPPTFGAAPTVVGPVRSTEVEPAPARRPAPPAETAPAIAPAEVPVAEPPAPHWIRRLAPVAAENLMYLLGGFLMVAGAIYFASTAWTTMSGTSRLLLLDGGLLGLGGLLVAGGRGLTRRFADAPEAARIRGITTHLAAGLLPIAAVIAGRVLLADPLAGMAALVVVSGAALGARWLAEGAHRPRAHFAALVAALAAAAAPFLADWPLIAALAAGGAATSAALLLPREPTRADLAHVAGGVAALVVNVVLVTGHIGAGSVAMAAFAFAAGGRIRGRLGALLLMALALVAVGPAFAAPRLLPLVCALATLSAARTTLRLDAVPLLPVALIGSLVAYVTTPAPMAELVIMLRDAFAQSMGYQNEPVPLAWYGLTCLPYVLGLTYVSARLQRTRPMMGRLAVGWLLLVLLGLCGLAAASSDPRAPMTVLVVYGVVLVGTGSILRNRVFIGLGPVALVAGCAVAGAWAHLTLPETLLLGQAALALLVGLAWPLTRRRGGTPVLLWSAALPIVAVSIAVAYLTPEPAAVPALAVAATGTALYGRRSGHPVWTALTLLLAFGAVRVVLPGAGAHGDIAGLVLAGLVLLGSEAHRLLRKRPRPRRTSWALPLALGGVATTWLIELSADPLHPYSLLPFAVIAVHTSVRFHKRWTTPLAVWLVGGTSAATLAWQGEPTGHVALAPALIALAAMVLARSTHARVRRHRAVLVPAAGFLAIAAAAGALAAEQTLWPAGLAALAFVTAVVAPVSRLTGAVQGVAMLLPAVVVFELWWALGAGPSEMPILFSAPLAYAVLDTLWRMGTPVPRRHGDLAAAGALFTTVGALAGLFVWALVGADRWAVLAAGLVLAGLAIRVSDRHRRAGTSVALATVAATVAVLLYDGPWSVPTQLDLVPIAAFGLLAAHGAPRVRLHGPTALGWARVVAGVLAVPIACFVLMTVVAPGTVAPEFARTGVTHPVFLGLWALLAISVAPRALRHTVAIGVGAVFACRFPVLSAAFGGPAPAIELAVLAALAGRDKIAVATLVPLALLATGGEVRSPVFALTLTALAAVPTRLGGRRPAAVETFVLVVFLAACAWLVALVPSSGRSPWEILPPLAGIAALFVMGLGWAHTRVAALADVRVGALRRGLGALAIGLIVANTAVRWGVDAPSAVLGCGALTLALLAAGVLRSLRRGEADAVDGLLLLAAVAHAFLAGRSALLAPIDGAHLLLWAAAAPALRWFGEVSSTTVRLRRRALWLPLPALLATAPVHMDSAIACLLAAAVWGVAARQSRRPAFTAIGLGLTFVAACRVLMSMDVVDPTFYGVPAGLLLIVGAWLERDAMSPRRVELLQLAGVLVADLSVAAQVVRLDDPLHAALLFAFGLATVAVGWVRRRGDLLVVGAVAIVADVTLYLVRTGFARGFLAAALLVAAGAVVLLVAGFHTRRRAAQR